MKEIPLKFMAYAALFLIPSFGIVACGDDDEPTKKEQNDKPINNEDPDEDDEVYSPEEQKEKMEAIALDLAEEVSAEDFEDVVDFGKYIKGTYLDDDNYDWSNVRGWAKSSFEELLQVVGTPKKETEEYDRYVYTYILTNYKAVVAASNFKAKFTANNGKWKQSSADNLQFVFTDQNGKNCNLSLTTSGSEKTLHVPSTKDKDYETYKEGNIWYDVESKDVIDLSIKVPEKIVVSLKREGASVVTATINFKLSSLQSTEFNFSKSSITLDAKIELNNGYVFNLSEVNLAPSKLAVSCSVAKDNKTLASVAASATPEGLPNVNLSALADAEGKFQNANAKNAYVKVDVMGAMQLQGQVSDVMKLVEYSKRADEYKRSETQFKNQVREINKLISVGLYYDNESTKQAKVEMQAFEEDNYYGDRWDMEPVLKFFDGSPYSTFESFFNKTDFQSVIEAYQKLAQEFYGLVD